MRRYITGLCLLALATGLLLTTGCNRFEKSNPLRIVSINRGAPIVSDLVDFGRLQLPQEPGEDPEYEDVFEIPTDEVEIDLQYVQIGLGLPTWTPYWANIGEAEINYRNVQTGAPYQRVRVGMNVSVEADPDGKSTESARLTIAPGWWKEQEFADELQVDPYEGNYGVVAQVTARVTVKGVDYVSGDSIQATKDCDIIFGNFWDDPNRLGQ